MSTPYNDPTTPRRRLNLGPEQCRALDLDAPAGKAAGQRIEVAFLPEELMAIALVAIATQLKAIATHLDTTNEYGETGFALISRAIKEGLGQ